MCPLCLAASCLYVAGGVSAGFEALIWCDGSPAPIDSPGRRT